MSTYFLFSFRTWITAGLAYLSTACAPVNILNAVVPDDGYQKIADIRYGPLERQVLDVYQPVTNTSHANTTIVFFYGGGWEAGERANYKFVAEALTSAGFTVVIPDYRVYPDVVFPAFVEDGALAMKWVDQHIADYGGQPQQVFIAGHSAGAHIAALLTMDKQYLQHQQLDPKLIRGMIGLAGPYDFLPLGSETLKVIFGPEHKRWRSQPINFVSDNQPPMLLMVGEQDETVLPKNTYHLAEKIKQYDAEVEVVSFEDYDHVAMVSKLAKPFRGKDQLRQAIVTFIERHNQVSPP